MPISIRLDPDTTARLERAARERKMTKSDLVKHALQSYLSDSQETTLWDRTKDLIAQLPPPKAKRTDRASNAKKLFKEAMRAKHSR